MMAILMTMVMIVAMLLAACGPTAAPQIVTQVIRETVVVAGTPQIIEKEVEVTKVVEVEKEVTATPEVVSFDKAPDPTTLTYVMADDAAVSILTWRMRERAMRSSSMSWSL